MFHPDYKIILHHSESSSKDTSNWIREKQDFQSDMGKNYFDSLKNLNVEIKINNNYTQYAPVFQADLIRWEILRTEGGIYLDTDQIIVKNFNSLLDCDMFFCIYHLPSGELYCPIGVLGSKPNHWIPTEIVKIIKSHLNIHAYQSIGPPFFRKFLLSYLPQLLSDKTIMNYPQQTFYPLPIPDNFCDQLYSGQVNFNLKHIYAIHWFGGFDKSHAFNTKYTKEFAQISNDSISVLLRKIGALK
jgi:mannosyltransferase OCH1-like enzyme